MIRCPHCGNENVEGTMFCEECGEPFLGRELEMPQTTGSVQTARSEHKPDPDLSVSHNDVQRMAHPQASDFNAPEQIVIHIVDPDERFEVDMFDAPVILGRADPGAEFEPDIELTPFGGVKLGVSRRHAIISWSEEGVTIEDLGSYNGTYLNGHLISPHYRRLLRDGDSLTLGELTLRIYFK
jgi:hypothetical protein